MGLQLRFEWDETKATANLEKHRVTFPFAIRVFLDPDRLELDASRAADAESRFKVIGMIEDKLYIVVATSGAACRIISARRANRTEDRTYGSR